jgi:hypothetical protein
MTTSLISSTSLSKTPSRLLKRAAYSELGNW